MTLAQTVSTLLSGKTLKWDAHQNHDGGSIRLDTAGKRRLFQFLLGQSPQEVLAGSEHLFPGLIAAWKNDTTDPAQAVVTYSANKASDSWRLYRIESQGFGGLNRFGGPVFDLSVDGENWCIEGQNGSGKTAFANSILWALTGQRVQEHVGPFVDKGDRRPVLDDHGEPIGTWPPLVTYPHTRNDLGADAEASVRLTFANADGEIAVAYRRCISPRVGAPTIEEKIDPRLAACTQLIDTGLIMPARLGQMAFGEGSQSLYEAVKRLTGLDQLADIANGVSNQFAHGARKFLKYAREQGADRQRVLFDKSIEAAAEKALPLGLDLANVNTIEADGLQKRLVELITSCSTEASKQLDILKSEIASGLDVTRPAAREAIRNAVTTAAVLIEEKPEQVPVFAAWKALADATTDHDFQSIPTAISDAERELATALQWHRRQTEDRQLRMKAVAAEWFASGADPSCPLCESALTTPQQRALAAELEVLKRDASLAERKIGDVCRRIERELRVLLPEAISSRLALLRQMEPRAAYAKAMVDRFAEHELIKSTLPGLATCIRDIVREQEAALPEFRPAPNTDASAANSSSPTVSQDPREATELEAFVESLRHVVALVGWWSEHRSSFASAFSNLRGRTDEVGATPERSIRGQIKKLEGALSKAAPFDDTAKYLVTAGEAAKAWIEIQAEQKIREAIRESLEPLKDLRRLVEAETARSIGGMSARIEAVLDRIHLRERLSYRNTDLRKKEIAVNGAFTPGMKIDAALVANTSWLRAILWAFILALRDETIQALGGNPFPLLLLDDPQTTFDPRNKLRWVKELAQMANTDVSAPSATQLIVTTHEHEFYNWLTELEKVRGRHGMIAPVDESSSVATIISGGCLERLWSEAESANSDAAARNYIGHVRIHAEKLLKLMLRTTGDVHRSNLEKLRDELKHLRANNVAPYNLKAFGELLKCLHSQDRALTFISDAHHSDAETLGVAQARDVHRFWHDSLEPKLLNALEASSNFEAFRGDARTFSHEPCVLEWPDGQREELAKASLIHTGIATAARTDSRARDGIVTIREWNAEDSTKIRLPNHELFRLTSGTLDPVAAIGDILIVSNYAKIHARGLVVAAIEDRLLARRYNEMEAHPHITVLTGQSIDPYALVEPVVAARADLKHKKVVGTLFQSGTSRAPSVSGSHEVVPVNSTSEYWSLLDGARLLKVEGRSAEPVALDGQYLITRDALSPADAACHLDGKLVVAVDSNSVKYFKRLRVVRSPYVILESLNSDENTTAELLSLSEDSNVPTLVTALPVVGVLFELPGAESR